MNNYHTHTFRCKHAEGDVMDYAAKAIEAGIDTLGMSDHIPYPDGRWSRFRMEPEEMEGYFRAIEKAREAFPELRMYRGLECEYVPEFHNYYLELKEQWQLDYMIGAVHWFPHEGEWHSLSSMTTPEKLFSFTDHLITVMESGLYLFIAHPDNFGCGYLTWDKHTESCSREIINTAAGLNIPLEVNGYGFRKRKINTPAGERRQYPLERFWEIAGEYQVPAVFNSDAHKPEDINANRTEGEALIEAHNLRVVDPMGVCCG